MISYILTSRPLVRPSKISSRVLSTNSNTKYSFPFLSAVLPLLGSLPLERLLEHDYVLMLESPQHLHLSHGRLLHDLVLIRVLLELLDGHYHMHDEPNLEGLLTEFPGLLVLGLVDYPVGALTDDAYNLVLVHVMNLF